MKIHAFLLIGLFSFMLCGASYAIVLSSSANDQSLLNQSARAGNGGLQSSVVSAAPGSVAPGSLSDVVAHQATIIAQQQALIQSLQNQLRGLSQKGQADGATDASSDDSHGCGRKSRSRSAHHKGHHADRSWGQDGGQSYGGWRGRDSSYGDENYLDVDSYSDDNYSDMGDEQDSSGAVSSADTSSSAPSANVLPVASASSVQSSGGVVQPSGTATSVSGS